MRITAVLLKKIELSITSKRNGRVHFLAESLAVDFRLYKAAAAGGIQQPKMSYSLIFKKPSRDGCLPVV